MGMPVVKTSDLMMFTVPPPLVIPLLNMPHTFVGSGHHKFMNLPVGVTGDEAKQPSLLAPMPYTMGSFTIPGTGMVKITLLPTQLTKVVKDMKKPVILATGSFTVQFTVSVPAMQPTPAGPVPDPVASKPPFTGQFQTTNFIYKAM